MTTQCSSCGGFCGKRCQRENINMEKFVGSGAPVVPEQFKPDYNTEAVLVEEMQRMGAEIAALHIEIDTLHKILITRAEQIVGLQDEIRNLTGEE